MSDEDEYTIGLPVFGDDFSNPVIPVDDDDEPWETYDPRDGSCSGCYRGGCTEDHPLGECCVSGPEWDEDHPGRLLNLRHARLIAAAPKMLAALKAIVNSDMAMREEDEGRESPELDAAREAIAQAEGGAK